jgi:acetoin:2,6-dichlorophenolindophenol oxidoreductase subunit beta
MHMPELSLREGLRRVLRDELTANPDLVLTGEAIATWGGASHVTAGLVEEFGPERVIETPVSENAIVGQALGAALAGLTACVEVYSADFLFCAGSEVINDTAKWRFQHRWEAPINLVMRMPMLSSGIDAGPEHTQAIEGYLHRTNGLVVVCPGSVKDALGGLRAALRCGDPVIFLEHRRLYDLVEDVSEADLASYERDLSTGSVAREGTDITVVAWGLMRQRALAVAEELQHGRGVSVEVIDPVTIKPMDVDLIRRSVSKTGRLLVVEEAPRTGSVSGEIITSVVEAGVEVTSLQRLTMPDLPNPFSSALEAPLIPDESAIRAAIEKALT